MLGHGVPCPYGTETVISGCYAPSAKKIEILKKRAKVFSGTADIYS
jgi:hypothetical protein